VLAMVFAHQNPLIRYVLDNDPNRRKGAKLTTMSTLVNLAIAVGWRRCIRRMPAALLEGCSTHAETLD
jgi:hypothetical protein